MAANVTVIPGAEEINYRFRNYAHSSILSDMPILSLGLATDLDRLVYKNAAGDPFTLATTADVGAGTFLTLTDTPSSYAGQGLKGVRVNTGATALEFYTPLYNVLTDGTTVVGDGVSTALSLDSTLKTNYDTAYSHTSLTNNPHSTTALQVGAEPYLAGTAGYILSATSASGRSWTDPSAQSWASKWTSVTGGIQYSSGSVSILNTAINTTESFTGLDIQSVKTAGVTDHLDTFTGASISTIMNQSGGVTANFKGLNVNAQIIAGSIGTTTYPKNWYSIYGRADLDGGALTLNCYGMYFAVDQEPENTIANDSYVVYANSDLLGSVLGRAYGIYVNDARDNLDFGIYVDSPAPNKFDGSMFLKESTAPSIITGYHGIYATSSGLYSMDDTSVYLLSAWTPQTGGIAYSGMVSIGKTTPTVGLDVTSSTVVLSSLRYHAKFGEDNSVATGRGGGIALALRDTILGGIQSYLQTSSDANAGMRFYVRRSDVLINPMTLNSTGDLQLNVTADSITASTSASKIFAKDIDSKARMHILDDGDTVAKPICASGTTSGVTIATGLTTTPSINIDYQITGKVVTLNVPEVTGAGNSSAMTITTLPTHLRPAATRYALIEIRFGYYRFLGSAKINTTGVIELESSYDCSGGQSFTAFYTNLSGSGIASQSIKYSL